MLYGIAFILASVAQYFKPQTGEYTNYNNYIIFKQAFFHLLDGKDLYIMYPAECWDLFKYSPAFALFMGVFAWLPDIAGLTLWNLLNAMVLWYGFATIPQATNRQKTFMLLFVFIELLTSIQNAQSNGLIAGLILLAFNKLENGDVRWSSLFITLTVFIKLFGLVAFALFLLYKQKPKFILWSIAWTLLLLVLPIVVSGYDGLLAQYQSWWKMLKEDHSASVGLSVMGWLQTWFGYNGSKTLITLGGVALFCLPLIKVQQYSDYTFRLLLTASVLLWVIIFNHKAESPTFVIAIAGAALWYFMQPKNTAALVLIALAFIFTSLSPTDLFPPPVRKQFIEPYVLKAVPCIFIWGVLIYQMMFKKYKSA
ncbi:glycosyltransferase family 87 protein [Oscillatoria amoena NRMC-F 0135]|nr:glycosyltransferase family 87 protein [Oscillatoria amoena NRMC-F 0135]